MSKWCSSATSANAMLPQNDMQTMRQAKSQRTTHDATENETIINAAAGLKTEWVSAQGTLV
jgi:hypothetical protein